jgi:hypothetical protein
VTKHRLILLAPLAALLAGLGALPLISRAAPIPASESDMAGPLTPMLDWHVPPAFQVRIEQHFQIRISPGGPQMPPEMLFELRQDDPARRMRERKTCKCVPAGGIAAVRAGDNNRLVLFLRDQRILTAALEKSCQARDFYSGFYVAASDDGLICENRDQLQSRSGANCRIAHFRELVEAGTRHFP